VTPALGRRLLAEAVGTSLLVGIGTGAIVAAAGRGGVPQIELALAWFVAVAVPILLFARLSGAHLNPVVTLALAVARRFPGREVLPYVAAQFVGAFAGSLAVLGLLGDGAHLGATLPAGDDLGRTFVLEFVFTLALVGSVLVLVARGSAVRRWELLAPPFVVAVSTFLIGPYTGSSLNPARTLAPGLLSGDLTGVGVYLLAAVTGALSAVVLLPQGRALARSPQPSRADDGP